MHFPSSNDTAFLKAIKEIAGEKTINDLFKLQQYLVIYIYQNCEIINYKFNETIFNYPVYEQHYSGLRQLKCKEAENIISFFRKKQLDSLAIIFPRYQKFIPVLNKINLKTKGNKTTIDSYFSRNTADSLPKTTLTVFKNGVRIGEIVITNSGYATNSIITAIKFEEFVPSKHDIEEIRIETQKD